MIKRYMEKKLLPIFGTTRILTLCVDDDEKGWLCTQYNTYTHIYIQLVYIHTTRAYFCIVDDKYIRGPRGFC